MKTITIYGTGCARCKQTEDVVRRVATEVHANVTITKVENMQAIVEAGVMATPAVAIDGAILLSGRIPRTEEVRHWFALSGDGCEEM